MASALSLSSAANAGSRASKARVYTGHKRSGDAHHKVFCYC